MTEAFKPYRDLPTIEATLSGAAQLSALPRQANSNDTIRIDVDGTANARIEWGDASVVASTTTSMRVKAGNTEVFTLDGDVSHISVAGSAGSTVSIAMGTGV